MRLDYSPQSRAERLIATGRLILVAGSLVAVVLDRSPATPARTLFEAVLVLYGAYAGLLAVVEWSLHAPLLRLRLLTHAFDLGVFALFTFLAEGPASPFLVYFVFSLAAATLRWQWRGTAWTAAAALGVFLGLGAYAGEFLRDPAFEGDRFVVRGVHLVVVAAMLGYMGAYAERVRREMAGLAAWPRTMPREVDALAREALDHAAAVGAGPRVALAWDDPEEPTGHLAWLGGGGFGTDRRRPTILDGLVAEPLDGQPFFCPRTRPRAPLVLHATREGLRRWHGRPLRADLQARFRPTSILALPLPSETVSGWLLVFDRRRLTSDALTLGAIVARQVAARLDLFYLAGRLQQAAATEERVRVARDLHDGVVQSLAGAALQLESARSLIDVAPAVARERLREIQGVIAAEQRALRAFIRQLRPAPPGAEAAGSTPTAWLEELRARVGRQWGLRVEVAVEGPVEPWPGALTHEVHRIVQEAVVNSARHAGASTARVTVATRADRLQITVVDDGHGFPFRGRRDLAALTRSGGGPRSVCERVAALGGDLVVESGEDGARIEIAIPLASTGIRGAVSPRPGSPDRASTPAAAS